MSFRTRLFITFAAAVTVTVGALSLLVRTEMKRRLAAEYERRIDAMAEVVESEIEAMDAGLAGALDALADVVSGDNRLRSAALGTGEGDRRYLLDYAGRAMRLAGMDMLQIEERDGRIISSGHFRNEFDRVDAALPRLLGTGARERALLRVRTPGEPFTALARVDSLEMGGRKFYLIGGIRVDDDLLSRLNSDGGMDVSLVEPGGPAGRAASRSESFSREMPVAWIDGESGTGGTALLRVEHGQEGLDEMLGSVDRWSLVVFTAAMAFALALAGWTASMVGRPLAELASRSSRLDLDRLDVDFSSARRDEIGALANVLAEMTGRLRAGALRIRDAERRATLGEMARQVNHDIKNGLTPIRNVFRHLAQLGGERPEELAGVFMERAGTVESSISYLEKLASNYARLYPSEDSVEVDLSGVAARVAADRSSARGVVVETDLCGGALVRAAPLALRRVVENLVGNAVESLGEGGGRVKVATRLKGTGAGSAAVVLEVSDEGCGMGREELERIFDDFYTTRKEGTGLGLSIVRRLVMDLGGTVGVESEPGRGSTFTVELPAAESEGEEG